MLHRLLATLSITQARPLHADILCSLYVIVPHVDRYPSRPPSHLTLGLFSQSGEVDKLVALALYRGALHAVPGAMP